MSIYRYILTDESKVKLAKAFLLSAERKNVLAMFLGEQVKDRFITAGASGGQPWKAKMTVALGVATKHNRPLTGATSNLLKSFSALPTDNGAEVSSALPYAAINQFGTVKYGGKFPTIKPVKAKALWIPITETAQRSQRMTGPIPFISRGGNVTIKNSGVTYAKQKTNKAGETTGYQELKKGRINDGKLQVWDARAGVYKDGTPDFIFLTKVDIPPRPMLPNSPAEQQAQRECIDSIMGATR